MATDLKLISDQHFAVLPRPQQCPRLLQIRFIERLGSAAHATPTTGGLETNLKVSCCWDPVSVPRTTLCKTREPAFAKVPESRSMLCGMKLSISTWGIAAAICCAVSWAVDQIVLKNSFPLLIAGFPVGSVVLSVTGRLRISN